MNVNQDKLMSLSDAVSRFVPDGAHISIGGFTINRNPMAAVYEIIRQRKRGSASLRPFQRPGVDELVGAGCVDRLEIAYAAAGGLRPPASVSARRSNPGSFWSKTTPTTR
jgi:glutaconate CoA-transferase subunit A